MKRIRRLLYPKGANGVWTPLFAGAIVITTAAVALAARPAKPSQENPAAAQRQKSPAETSAYDKWLNEEVVYIITKEERAAFLKLTADEERNKFIAQFWERRNPNPGAPENAFKREHYRRIGYANEHFASNTDPGWKTARGHMYILYGPPDEIDSHPDGPPYPFEEWRYKHAAGLGDNVILNFIDPTRDGSYRIAPGPPR